MQIVDTIIQARWIIPIIPRETVYEHYSLVIDQGKIQALLPTADAMKQFQAKNVVERPDHVLLPGLVNAHTHSPMVLLRGLADDKLLMDWLENTIWPAENKFVNTEFIQEGMQLAMAEMISSGTTCINEHYFYPEIAGPVIAETGIRARLGLLIMDVAIPGLKNAAEGLEKAKKYLALGSPTDLIRYSLAPHSPYTNSDETLLKIKALSEEFDLPIHMHVHEPAHEISQSLSQFGKRPLQRLADLGLVNHRLQNVHLTQVIQEDIEILKNSGAHVIHCPESNLKLASGYCPVQQLLNAGINLGLGTDGAASNNDLDLFGEMHIAALIGKTIANDPTACKASDILEMATLGGAKALALDSEIGSLEANKAADLIAVNLNELNTVPVYHPISQLVYATHSHQVSDVWVAGKALLKNRELQTLDRDKCLGLAQKWRSIIEDLA